MGLTDRFNNWIIEHGSAIVQEKHIAFFRDQLTAADKKISTLEQENISLKQENTNLKSALDNANKEINRLTSILSRSKNEHATKYEKQIENTLLFIFNHRGEFSANEVASGISMDIGIVDHYIKLLEKDGLIEQSSGGDPPKFEITLEGSAYVMKNLT